MHFTHSLGLSPSLFPALSSSIVDLRPSLASTLSLLCVASLKYCDAIVSTPKVTLQLDQCAAASQYDILGESRRFRERIGLLVHTYLCQASAGRQELE